MRKKRARTHTYIQKHILSNAKCWNFLHIEMITSAFITMYHLWVAFENADYDVKCTKQEIS